MKKRCMECGCVGTISYSDVKDKKETSWRHLDKVKITVSLMLNYCSNCGNTPMFSEDYERQENAIEESLAKKYLNSVYLIRMGNLYKSKNTWVENIYSAELFDYEYANNIEYDNTDAWPISLYSELHNQNIDKTLFLNLARQLMYLQMKERKITKD